MCFFNPGPERRVPSPNRYIAEAKLCFCKNNKRTIIMRIPSCTRRLRNISSGCALVCMCVLCVDMTRDAMIDTRGERNRV